MKAVALAAGLAVAVFGAATSGANAVDACAPEVIDFRAAGAEAQFQVEIADTPETRRVGLMHRTDLAADAGMLFVFDPPQKVAFWMKDTPLALDLIFLDRRGVVRRVTEAAPFSEDVMRSDGEVRAVLEVNAGAAASGVGPGAVARHPAFASASPLWPCN